MTEGTAKQQLVTAARALIADQGWAAATTRQIADRAGLNPALVHYHFGSITRLRTTAIVGAIEDFFAAAFAAAERKRSTNDRLNAIFQKLSGADDHFIGLLIESLVAARNDPSLRETLGEMIGKFRAQVRDWLSDVGDPQPESTATLMTTALDGYWLQRSLDPTLSPSYFTTALAAFVGNFNTRAITDPDVTS